jgi:aspartyl-tRNA(Asn)/glutamyl-tRNA(Gln) amidotransferase subunit B
MPELPSALHTRLQSQYGISARDAEVLMFIESGSDVGYDGEAEKGSAVNYFEQVADGGDPKVAANW